MSTDFWVGPAHEPDRIRLGGAAASGAEGVLYRGFVDLPDSAVPVAVKMLHPGHLARLEEWTARWRDQIRLLRQVEIPGLVAVRGGFVGPLPHTRGNADPSTASLYLVMDWIEGVSLDQWVRSLQDPEPEQLLLGLVPVAAALDLLHSGAATGGQPVVHRDVKPANILVRPDGNTVLVDLGSIRGLLGGNGRASLVGTAGYMAPEVLDDGRYGPAADRYSLGAVAYFLLTGEEPVGRPAPGEHHRRLLAAPLLDGRADLADHIAAMLDPDPGRRPECLANWVAQLRRSSLTTLPGDLPLRQRAPTRQPTSTVTAPPSRGTSSVTGTRRRFLALAAAIAVVSVAVATIALVRHRDPDQNLVAADRPGSVVVADGPTTASTDVPTTVTPASTTVVPTHTSTSSAPAAAPAANAGATSTTRPAPPPEPPRYRATPAITAVNESYGVEVIGDASQPGRVVGTIRRQDLQGATVPGPDDYPASHVSSWVGTFGRRCLTTGGSGTTMSVRGEPAHVYAFGVVGVDAVKVEIVGTDGRRVTATLGDRLSSLSVRWWIADHAGYQPSQVVATDASGEGWAATDLVGTHGQVGC